MKIINTTTHSIHIGDINITVPNSKNAPIEVKDETFLRSNEAIDLIKSGAICVTKNNSLSTFKTFVNKGNFLYKIFGHTIWEGKGKTVPIASHDFLETISFDEINELRKEYSKTVPKKYIITKNCGDNISLEKISRILTKQCPSLQINEDYYLSKDIQNLIKSNRVIVSKVLSATVEENNKIVFKESNNPSPEVIVDETLPEYKNVNCFWEGPILDTGGYANMNRQYIFNLSKIGVSVKPVVVVSDNHVEKVLREKINKLMALDIPANSPKVYATNVPSKHSGSVVAYTMMETELNIHKDLAKQLNKANEIWVPSEWNREIFSKATGKDVKVMPLGVDSEIYKPREQSVYFSFPVKKYVFYAVSTWIWRKGWDVLLKAYMKAFTADDDVSLVIFAHVPAVPTDQYTEHIKKHIMSMFPGKDISKFPNLSIITSILPSSIVPLIYNSVNSFVLFSRGEGWGLPYCEAAASGLPIIGADHGGQKMFLDHENSLLVEPDLVSMCHPSLLYMTPFYKGMKFANYSEKAIDDAAEKMRYAYENQDEMKIKADKCRDNLLEKFNWNKCARRVADRLKEI